VKRKAERERVKAAVYRAGSRPQRVWARLRWKLGRVNGRYWAAGSAGRLTR
jgi:hypothetical protein